VQRYLEKISGPLRDRIDLIVNVPRDCIMRCRNLEKERCGKLNSDLDNPDIEWLCALDQASEKLLATAVDKLKLSARACHRILKIARTIADMNNHENIELGDLIEAVAYRRMDLHFSSGSLT